MNDAHYYDIYQYVDMAQNDYLLLVGIRDKEHGLNMVEVEVEREIARLNYDTKIRVITLDTAGKNLLLKADEYDARVKEQIMLAKEYLAAVQNKELWLEKDRAEMAVEREEAKLKEIQAKLLLEEYERKTVEVQIARAEVDAAKAAVQAILADIGKEEAKIKIITTEVEYRMAKLRRLLCMQM